MNTSRSQWRKLFFWIGLVVSGVGLLAMAVPVVTCGGSAPTAMRNACINNLRMIEMAKQEWARENNKELGGVPGEEEIFGSEEVRGYMRHPPKCPSRGKYVVGAIGREATCSLAAKGHRIN